MNVFLFIISVAYLLVFTRLVIVGLDCYDTAPQEVRDVPYWMFLTSVLFNAAIFPISLVAILIKVIGGNLDD